MAYTANDCFCAITDVEGIVGRGTYSGTTTPTNQQVLDWMARRSAEVEARLASGGQNYTVSSRGTPFPGSPTAIVARLKILAELATSHAAAADAILMHEMKPADGVPSAAATLLEAYEHDLEQIDLACKELTIESAAASQVSYETSTDNLEFGMDERW